MNGQEEAILRLWNEGMMPRNIALKLGIDQDIVEDIIEAPGNYFSEEEIMRFAT